MEQKLNMGFWTKAIDNETLWMVQTDVVTVTPFEPSMTSSLSTFQKMEITTHKILSSSNATTDSAWNSSIPADSELFQFTWESCVFTLLASLMSLTTILANVILIILVCVDTRLRRYSNYYIISLACADLLVGAFVIPMFSLYTIAGRWPLGPIVCELWIISDFTCLSASVFSICMISLDRYWAITQPLKHLQRQRRKRALLTVGGIWIVAGFCWTPAVVAHGFIYGSFEIESACLYLPGFIYVLLSNTLIYFLPMVTMVCLYVKMMYALKKHLLKLTKVTELESPDPTYARTFCCCRETIRAGTPLVDNKHVSVSTISFLVDSLSAFDVTSIIDRHIGETHSSRSSFETLEIPQLKSASYRLTKDEKMGHQEKSGETAASSSRVLQETHRPTRRPATKYSTKESSSNDSYSDSLKAERIRQHQLSKHRLHLRTARTLGIIVVSFLMCWMPFVILFPINSYCNCIPVWLYDMSYWLAYLNSTLNPFLYGFNKDFRRAFRKLIFSSKKTSGEHSENYRLWWR